MLSQLKLFLKHLIVIFLSISLLANNAFAQNKSELRGVVRDSKTGEKLIGVVVSIKGSSYGTATDFEGEFKLKINQPLPITLVVTYLGYAKTEIKVENVSKIISVGLKEDTKSLNEVEVKDTRITEKQKQSPLTVETMNTLAIRQTSALSFYEGLAQLKGVDMISASLGFNIINTRGFNSTSPVRSLQLIDGADNQAPGLNFSLGNFLGSSELDIQKVDLIVGASSAYYGPNAFNGVIDMQTKSPFQYPGLSAQVKVGERNLLETSVRWAQKFKTKSGKEIFAYKFNISYMKANDWKAENYNPTTQSPNDAKAGGGYDAVNRYGDEYNSNRIFYQDASDWKWAGYGYSLRGGYKETDLIDNKMQNLKLGAAFHLKLNKDNELIYTSSFGNGSTIYQGDDRFALKDILFFQNKIELRKEGKYFIRAYATNENAGNSFDIYSTALLLQNGAKTDKQWAIDYQNSWSQNVQSQLVGGSWYTGFGFDTIFPLSQRGQYIINYMNTRLQDSILKYHNVARQTADLYPSATSNTGIARFEPGTARFDSALNYYSTHTIREGGSKFFDQSALYHIAGEYRFSIVSFDFITGGNFRLYAPYSKGNIFLDTADRIYNKEYGVYLGIEKKVLNEKLKLSMTNRVDKNDNFGYLWSPAATAVYVMKKNVFRVSVSSALRNPTLTDQYINLDVGRATLMGNLHGFDSLATINSLVNASNATPVANRSLVEYFHVDPVKPEKVQTIEFGYRTTVKDKLYFDASYYYSTYYDFIGYKIGAIIDWPPYSTFLQKAPHVLRVATNSKDIVTTQGVTIGMNYFFRRFIGLNLNFSWNKLDRHNSTDPLIPAYNTPERKYNIGVGGRDFKLRFGSFELEHLGYNINWKWQSGFTYEGSPQFTGDVSEYGMLDLQVNKMIPVMHSTIKMGASNILNNQVYTVYGGPLIGRMAYISILVELDNWK